MGAAVFSPFLSLPPVYALVSLFFLSIAYVAVNSFLSRTAPTTSLDGIFANLRSAFGFLLIAAAFTFFTSAGFDGFLA